MTTLDLSRNEFSSMVQKACVGVGTDTALSGDIASACLDLQAAGVASLEHLLPLLATASATEMPSTHIDFVHSQNGYFAPTVTVLRNGGSVMDHLCLATVTIGTCDDCVLLASMVHAGCVLRRRFVRLISPGIGWAHLDHAYLKAALGRLAGPITFRFVPEEGHEDLVYPAAQNRVHVDTTLWADLQTAAAAVLVPADDTTRLRDAGAGLDDND